MAELFALRPERVSIETDANGWPVAYRYAVGARVMRLPAEDAGGRPSVIHIRHFHPLDDHLGLGCLGAAMGAIAIHNAATRWNKALLDNAARPSGALVYDPGDGSSLSAEQYRRLKEEMAVAYQGAGNAGRPMLLEGGLKWQAISMTPADMDFVGLKAAAAREIALAFGVPPMLMGLPGDAAYANYREANRALWRSSVVPMADNILGAIAEGLRPWFPGATLKVAIERVAVLRRSARPSGRGLGARRSCPTKRSGASWGSTHERALGRVDAAGGGRGREPVGAARDRRGSGGDRGGAGARAAGAGRCRGRKGHGGAARAARRVARCQAVGAPGGARLGDAYADGVRAGRAGGEARLFGVGEVSVLRFAGYAAIFDRADRGGDVVRRGAFTGAGCVPLLWQHRGPAVGAIERVFEDARGLAVVGRIEDPGLAAMVAAGALTGLSFGYRARAVRHRTYRELIGLDLNEVSLVAQPMQPLARVTAFEWLKEDETA